MKTDGINRDMGGGGGRRNYKLLRMKGTAMIFRCVESRGFFIFCCGLLIDGLANHDLQAAAGLISGGQQHSSSCSSSSDSDTKRDEIEEGNWKNYLEHYNLDSPKDVEIAQSSGWLE